MHGFNMTLTIGAVLEEACDRGLRVDVETATGRVYESVMVAALEQFCVVLLDDGDEVEDPLSWRADGRRRARAHVVSRDHVAGVSLDRAAFLQIEPQTVDLREHEQPADAAYAL